MPAAERIGDDDGAECLQHTPVSSFEAAIARTMRRDDDGEILAPSPVAPIIVIGVDHGGQAWSGLPPVGSDVWRPSDPAFRPWGVSPLASASSTGIEPCSYVQILVIVVIDLDHRRGGAIAHALDLGERRTGRPVSESLPFSMPALLAGRAMTSSVPRRRHGVVPHTCT